MRGSPPTLSPPPQGGGEGTRYAFILNFFGLGKESLAPSSFRRAVRARAMAPRPLPVLIGLLEPFLGPTKMAMEWRGIGWEWPPAPPNRPGPIHAPKRPPPGVRWALCRGRGIGHPTTTPPIQMYFTHPYPIREGGGTIPSWRGDGARAVAQAEGRRRVARGVWDPS